MKLLYKLLALLTMVTLSSCGSGGSGGDGSSTSAASAADSAAAIKDKIWAIPVSTTAYGQCAVAMKLGSSGKFGLVFICNTGVNQYSYEAVYGTFTTSGNQITLTATPDGCSTYRTIFWDPSNTTNSAQYTFSLEGNSLRLTNLNYGVLSFIPVTSSNSSSFPFVASRGCFVNSAGNYSWQSYLGNSNPTAVDTELNTQTAQASGNKPKLDLVIFQDNSDSLANAMAQIKPQLQSFVSALDTNWDYRVVVMPLLYQQSSMSSKVMIAADCSSVPSNVGQCVGASSISYFNNLGGDAGWLNSRNTAAGNTDQGFSYMNLNVNTLVSSGVLRTDSFKAFVVVSNGEDNTSVAYLRQPDGSITGIDYNSPTTINSFNAYLSYFTGLKSSISLSKFYSVVAANRYSDCWGGGMTWAGKRYMDLASGLGGASYDLCNNGLPSVLSSISSSLQTVVQTVEFNYAVISATDEPNPNTIVIQKNGVTLANSAANGWTYVGLRTGPTTDYPTVGDVQTGYMVQLNGTAKFKGSDMISISFQKK